MFDFAKEMYFDEKTLGTESDRDKSLIRLPKLTAFMEGFFKEEITSKSKVPNYKGNKKQDGYFPIVMNFRREWNYCYRKKKQQLILIKLMNHFALADILLE